MANPNSSAQRSFAAEPYDSVATVEDSRQITSALEGQWIFTKNGEVFQVLSDSVTDFTHTTLGGAKLRIVDNSGMLDLRVWGPMGNSVSGDDQTLRNALKYMGDAETGTGRQGVIRFAGALNLRDRTTFGKNVVLQGAGQNFRSEVRLMAALEADCAFAFEGDDNTGGFVFRSGLKSLMINSEKIASRDQLPAVVKVHKAYQIHFDDLMLFDTVGNGFDIDVANWITLMRPAVYGRNTGASDAGILVRSGGTGAEAGGGVKVIAPDLEVFFRGIDVLANGSVDILGGYAERCIQGWRANNTTGGHVTVVGGEWTSPGASGEAARIEPGTHNVTVMGGAYRKSALGGHGLRIEAGAAPINLHIAGVEGDITDLRNRRGRTRGDSTRWYSTKARSQKDLVDATKTALFTVTFPFTASHHATVEVEVNARDNSGFSTHSALYRFSLTNPDGTLRKSDLVEFAKTTLAASANYGLAVTCEVDVSGTTATFSVTADSTGTTGQGQAPRVSAEARLVQWAENGAVYIQSV